MGDAGSAQYRQAMATLQALTPLRQSEPQVLLQRLRAPPTWAGQVKPAEAALLQAQTLLLTAAAHFALVDYASARADLAALATALALPAAAAPALQRQARQFALQAMNMDAFIAHRTSDFPAALRGYLGALAEAQALDDRPSQARLHANLANTYEESGLAAEAIEHHRQALALAQGLQLQELVHDVEHNLSNALAAAGDAAAGLASAQQALAGFVALGLPHKQAMALLAISEHRLELGQTEAAAAALAQRLGLAAEDPVVEAYAAGLGARIALATGAPARAALEHAHALNRRTDDRAGQARALIALARLDIEAGDAEAAAQQAQAALAALAGTAAGRELVDAHLWASRAAEARGDTAAALAQLKLHHAAYERLFNEQSARKARLLAVRHQVELANAEAERQRLENKRLHEALAEVATRLQQLEGRPARPAAAPQGPAALRALGLTPREAEVLYWVTQGKTNEDVAAILDTGLAAVKKNLGRIYDKLGVENRTAAAAEVRRRGAG